MAEIHDQLTLFGFQEVLRRAEASGVGRGELKRIQAAHQVLGEGEDDDLSFLHSGLCQTALPHKRPEDDSKPWERRAGRLCLIVQPGTGRDAQGSLEYIGVPYGTKSRLIMIYLQTEGVKDKVVPLGNSMSAWIRSLGLPVTGGPRGTIGAIKEQVLRIANCSIKLEWDDPVGEGVVTNMRKTDIVKGLSMWAERPGREKWPTQVELSEEFHEHLKAHAVPLDRRAIAHLSGNSLGLDLYTTLAYRLPRLDKALALSWRHLMGQFGSEDKYEFNFAQRLRAILPDVLAVYPEASVEVSRHGLVLKPSKPAVPRSRTFISRPLRTIGK